jgi:hypothetical protein
MKLKEDAYHLTNYVPWFATIEAEACLPPEEADIGTDLKAIAAQTAESIEREIQRIRSVLSLCRRLFIAYLPQHRENRLLARFIYSHLDHIASVYADQSHILLRSVYGSDLEPLIRLAAASLRDGGWTAEADQALRDLPGTAKDPSPAGGVARS